VLAVTSMWLVGVASLVLLLLGLGQFWSLGRDRLGRLGVAGVAVSAFALAAMALGNGIELYTVTARGTESDIGHTIFLIAFLILIVASILLGQILVRRRWSVGVRWAGLLLLLVAPLGILFLVVGGALSPETDLGFWSALSVPYAIARVLLAVFASRVDDMTTGPVAVPGGAPLPYGGDERRQDRGASARKSQHRRPSAPGGRRGPLGGRPGRVGVRLPAASW
jgi:hypothetical protein